jgi:hypothetical protein
MKALQQRKKNMAKRAEETKKKQVSEKEELKPQKDIAKEQDENKENILIQYPEHPELELEQPGRETILQDQQEAPSKPLNTVPEPAFESTADPASGPAPEPVPVSVQEPVSSASVIEPVTEPVVEPTVELVPEPVLESAPEPAVIPEQEVSQSLEPSQLEPIANASVVSSEIQSSSSPLDTVVDSTFETKRVAEPLDTVQVETLQTAPEDETRIEHEEPAITGLAPPLNDEVPLQNKSSDAPQPDTEDITATHPESIPNPDVPIVEPLDEPVSAEVPESIPLPATPSVTPPDSTDTETPAAPVSVSVYPSPVDESTPYHTPAAKGEVLTLDQRRKVHLEPIQVSTPEFSDDDNLLSDDSFMEELTSATVQEARPVSVKSPNGGDHAWRSSRAVSSPYSTGSSSAMQTLAAGRSISSSYSENGPPTPVLMAKKINVSSGISSRIKALEKFSSREGTPIGASPAPSAPSASSSVENLRKRGSISLPSGHLETTPPGTMHSAQGHDSVARTRTPSLNRHDRRLSVDAMRRANSVSVTARIVRDADNSPGSSGLEPSESDVLNLQASPLTVEHETTDESLPQASATELVNRPVHDRSMSMSSNGSGRPTSSRPASRLSTSSRSRTDETILSASPTSEDKKSSRTSRFMRRVSSITSTSRRSVIGALSSPVKEEEHAPTFTNGSTDAPGSTGSRTSEPIDIGEVNVQFPETLLWKRRVMRIDENGYVVLTPGTNDATARNMTKRYHLTEFRTPCLPDEDNQELPNSILLDFLDGNTLQCACETRQGQASALQSKYPNHNPQNT